MIGNRTLIFAIVGLLIVGFLSYETQLSETEFVACFMALIGLFGYKKHTEHKEKLNGGNKT